MILAPSTEGFSTIQKHPLWTSLVFHYYYYSLQWSEKSLQIDARIFFFIYRVYLIIYPSGLYLLLTLGINKLCENSYIDRQINFQMYLKCADGYEVLIHAKNTMKKTSPKEWDTMRNGVLGNIKLLNTYMKWLISVNSDPKLFPGILIHLAWMNSHKR